MTTARDLESARRALVDDMGIGRNGDAPRPSGDAVQIIGAIAEAVRTAGEIPSGAVYAMACGALDLGQYQRAIGILKRAGLVEERGHMLRWVGPEIGKTGGAR